MGCVVNGPGEAREADLGVASGNGKGQIFVKGEVIKTVPESQIVETLVEEALRLAEEMGVDVPDLTGPTVSVVTVTGRPTPLLTRSPDLGGRTPTSGPARTWHRHRSGAAWPRRGRPAAAYRRPRCTLVHGPAPRPRSRAGLTAVVLIGALFVHVLRRRRHARLHGPHVRRRRPPSGPRRPG